MAGSWGRKARAQLYGTNDMSIGRPSFPQLVLFTLSNPVYLVQVITIILTMLSWPQGVRCVRRRSSPSRQAGAGETAIHVDCSRVATASHLHKRPCRCWQQVVSQPSVEIPAGDVVFLSCVLQY